MSERSVPATAHQVARARREGDLPLSPLLLLGASLLTLRQIAPRSFESVRSSFTASWRASFTAISLRAALELAGSGLARTLFPALLALAAVATCATLLQTGAAYRSLPQRDRREAEGFTALASVVVSVASVATALASFPDAPSISGVAAMARAAIDAMIAALFGAGVVDLAIRRWRWREQLQSTPGEARRAARDEEGDPFVRVARRSAHHALLEGTAVGSDWHVLLDGRGTLVALVWREGMSAPVVVLHAEGALGAEIVANAEKLGCALHLRPDLVRALRDVSPGASPSRAAWNELAALIAGAAPAGSLQSG